MAELVAAVAAYLVLGVFVESRGWPKELAWSRSLGLLKGAAFGAGIIAMCVGALALLGVYRVQRINSRYDPWMALLTVGLATAVAEEIIMRGVLFRLVEEWLGTWGAVAVSGAIFGAAHLFNPDGSIWGSLALAVEAGLLFAAVYVLTRSLWWSMGLHFGWNVVQGPVFGSIVSGDGQTQSWLVAAWRGPDILTGGVFGLEGSVVPVILGALLGLGILVYAQRQGVVVVPRWRRLWLADRLTPPSAK